MESVEFWPPKPSVRPSPAGSVCRLFTRRACTGCTQLDRAYERQLATKQAALEQVFAPIVGEGRLRPIVPSPQRLGWRTSVKLCLHEDRTGRRAIGLYRAGTHQVVATQGCAAQAPEANRLVERLFARGGRPPARLYDHAGRVFQRGRLKYLVIRSAPPAAGTGAQGLLLAHTGVPRADLAAWIMRAGLAAHCVYETRLTPGDGDEWMGRHVAHLSGPEVFGYRLGGELYELTPMAFFQANHGLAPALIDAASDFGTANGGVLLDLYGGFGAYSIPRAARFQRLIVVDGNPHAIAAAARRHLTHLEARATTVEGFLEQDLGRAAAALVTHVIVNPPRSGLSRRVISHLTVAKLPALRELRYVSCNPATLARDLAELQRQGLKVSEVRPFDMFPQTDHVEVVARLVAAR